MLKKDTGLFVLGLFILVPGFGYVLYMILRVPSIQLNNQSIRLRTVFGIKTIYWNEIKSISLTGKYSRGIGMNSQEAVALHLKNNQRVLLWVEFYANQHEIRQTLEKINQSISTNASVILPNIESLHHDLSTKFNHNSHSEKFAGNPYINFNSLTFYVLCGVFIYFIISRPESWAPASIVFTIPVAIVYFAVGSQLNYFLLSGDELIIKNHFFPWKKHQYNLTEVREFVLERPYKSSKSLRVITKDFRDKLYPAGSLRSQHWLQLSTRIKELGIPLRIVG